MTVDTWNKFCHSVWNVHENSIEIRSSENTTLLQFDLPVVKSVKWTQIQHSQNKNKLCCFPLVHTVLRGPNEQTHKKDFRRKRFHKIVNSKQKHHSNFVGKDNFFSLLNPMKKKNSNEKHFFPIKEFEWLYFLCEAKLLPGLSNLLSLLNSMRLSTWLESLNVDIFKAEIYVHAFSTSFLFFSGWIKKDRKNYCTLTVTISVKAANSSTLLCVCFFSFAILHKSKQSFLDCVYFLYCEVSRTYFPMFHYNNSFFSSFNVFVSVSFTFSIPWSWLRKWMFASWPVYTWGWRI